MSPSYFSLGEHKTEQTSQPNNNGPVAPAQHTDTSAEPGEQDADDEAAEDTDDTRCV